MSAKHTPEPWRIVYARPGFDRDFGVKVDGCIGVVVAEGDVRVEEAHANARLIAAAPDLLAALRDVEAHHVEINKRAGRAEADSWTLTVVRAAIAKVQP